MSEQSTPNLPSWQEFHNELIVKALKDESFRQELLANPKAVVEQEMGKLKEGSKLPAGLEVKVIQQPANALYLVLPTMPEELSDEALDNVAGGRTTTGFLVPIPFTLYGK
ncbi:NHLP leader peptide family RiPP precursor [Desulfosporosinus lacus]|uniref:NHLP leader peptide domain-containing protein n=1 Tax=Desulfosporosinus lacus DSM 15449 TaxID=1121420 RepID=A0A1M5XEA6_9FIRM|nr:NHLP leader peptide family RiPP precursor [Desulfosporosinus lacus]SHH98089.1 NHLP leader peptide domain-containing protein [Desulfosporosinus lacus DSM 15449]